MTFDPSRPIDKYPWYELDDVLQYIDETFDTIYRDEVESLLYEKASKMRHEHRHPQEIIIELHRLRYEKTKEYYYTHHTQDNSIIPI